MVPYGTYWVQICGTERYRRQEATKDTGDHKEEMMATKSAVKPKPENASEPPVRRRILEAAFSAFMERGFAETSTLEIATRARASKRELYALFGSKQDILIACIRARAKRFEMPAELPEPRDREMLARVLAAFGRKLLREVSDPAVITVFRLAIAEALRTPEVAQALNAAGMGASRAALREIMIRARANGLLDGQPTEMAEQFAGLLWGNRMLGLLLRVAERPTEREITRRAEAASSALLRLYPAPGEAD
jgi:AcrR family transcriptional regulator